MTTEERDALCRKLFPTLDDPKGLHHEMFIDLVGDIHIFVERLAPLVEAVREYAELRASSYAEREALIFKAIAVAGKARALLSGLEVKP